ncbi:hypothetical protein R5H30_08535 [Sulfitobacter sp. D35]|uniref:hypothetical protein n=1 Tax=Sulfitobacter sp. D35 TaxID=3083252 RepID=UPI00296FDF4B|nr:hypothetical protein [Sulfitobacter sp. D35]MDW4498021.1 hypothetical protein [Sulfitobacter sp. D35]
MEFLPKPARTAVVRSAFAITGTPSAALKVSDITLTSAEVDPVAISTTVDSRINSPSAPESGLPAPNLPDSPVAEACATGFTATPVAAAMVELTLVAPCSPGAEVLFSHAGLVFSEMVGEDGRALVMVPALRASATFEAAIPAGKTLSVTTSVESLPLYRRTVLLTTTADGLELHAREFGAEYGAEGHVWSGARRGIEAVTQRTGGFMVSLGNGGGADGYRADVYTFPRALQGDTDPFELSLEAEISGLNCGREIDARVLSLDAASKLVTTDVTLSVPGCDAIGDFLVLKYPPQDLTVAAR